uniref:VWFA domain-containing protein n=1 Tax=Oryzias melastigma TaxID=30732 RepID=A0A3B3CF61_ORYME
MIAHNPSYAFSVLTFDDVGSIQQQLVSFVKRVPQQRQKIKMEEVQVSALTKSFNFCLISDFQKRDIVFLLDGSDDSQQRFIYITDFVERIVRDLNIDVNGDHVAVVQYSNSAEINFNLSRYVTENDVLKAIKGLNHKGGYPHNIGAALEYVLEHVFSPESGSRLKEGVPQILILLSGDRSRDDIRTPVKLLKETGILVIYALFVSDYEELPVVQQDVLSLLKFTSNHFAQMGNKTRFGKLCFLNFHTHMFESKDVVFLIDGSFDSRNGFEEIREFVKQIVEILNIGNDGDKVAMVQYSRVATVNFYLNSYSSRSDVLKAIKTIRHKYGRPLNTGYALEFVRDHVFAASVGGRHKDSVLQYLLIFSGGRSGDDVRGPAQSLRENGIVTFSFGTENADTLEMQTISSTPAHYFLVSNYKRIMERKKNICNNFRRYPRGKKDASK